MKKYLFIVLGITSFIFGSIGALLPILPTTPFLLLAAFFFTRSSNRFNDWLERTKLYQFYVADYAQTKSIPKSKKWKIIVNVYILMGISIYFAPINWVKIILGLLTIGISYVLFFVIPDKDEEYSD